MLGDYLQLGKARLSLLVTVSAAAGLAAHGFLPGPITATGLFTGTYLLALSAGAMNQMMEIAYDAMMQRTRNRPLPAGRLDRSQALAFCLTTLAAGTAVLLTTTTVTTTALGLTTFALYGVYTRLKRTTPLSYFVGSVVGALPPLMGWAAVSLHNPGMAALLFSYLYMWQIVHFASIVWRYRDQYTDAGYQLMARDDPRGDKVASYALTSAFSLAAMCGGSALLDITSPLFGVAGTLANAPLLLHAYRFWSDPERTTTDRSSRRLLISGFIAIIVTLLFLAVDNVVIHRARLMEAERAP